MFNIAMQLALLKGARESSLIRVCYVVSKAMLPYRSTTYPSPQAKEDLRVKSLDLSFLVFDADDPSQDPGVFAAKDRSLAKVSSVNTKSVQSSHDFSSPSNLEIFQIV